ncbi:polysaccharide lyase family 7 protein [Marilutibacter chinensis]|uniref:Polysaccharide lyase family 7 protein n=1 Tax=Marilutibacter chinensis TaxID=2912247 RepID=A0ABS9HV79_9GAMM|nr:polysaccharide lyase family 7 protein [Lysobacter chinensis]MCF7222790.1 polysaccharide lyase family 7 protein [Lysobacter chinensis]
MHIDDKGGCMGVVPFIRKKKWTGALPRGALLFLQVMLGVGISTAAGAETQDCEATGRLIAKPEFGFEGESTGDMPAGFDTYGTVEVTAANRRAGHQAVRLARTASGQVVRMLGGFRDDQSGYGRAESGRLKLSLYVPADITVPVYVALFQDSYLAEMDRVIELAFMQDGTLRNRGPEGTGMVGSYQAGKWNDVELIWDGIANTGHYMLLVNGSLVDSRQQGSGYLPVEHKGKVPMLFELKYGANGAAASPDVYVDEISLRGPYESTGFDASLWKITLPDGDDRDTGWLLCDNTSPGEFYYKKDGSLIFKSPNIAGHTVGSKYSRSELREMLVGVDAGDGAENKTQGVTRNNWVLSTASDESQSAAGGVDGNLKATLKVENVSTTGRPDKIGRVVIGQIHASEDEPVRLYYRKLPGNTRGSIYLAQDIPGSDEENWQVLVGSRDDNATDPADGIRLGEPFSYEIKTQGHRLTVVIRRPGKPSVSKTVDLGTLYDSDWMYFKAGVYNQNNGCGDGADTDEDGKPDYDVPEKCSDSDYVQARFYSVKATHGRP